jgi:hypothetical protein
VARVTAPQNANLTVSFVSAECSNAILRAGALRVILSLLRPPVSDKVALECKMVLYHLTAALPATGAWWS